VLAIISDIHANVDALEAVLSDIDAQKITDVVCLGDVVGYGPTPMECVDLVQSRCRFTVMGNHEEALLHGAYGFHLRAARAIDWTRDQLKPGFFSGQTVRKRWDFLATLPLRHEAGPDLFIHGSPRQPTQEYLLGHEVGFGPTEKYEEVFAAFERLLFVGHTHLPGVITDDYAWLPANHLEGAAFRLAAPGRRAVINVGSVGQPRDHDPRACYAVVEGDEVRWRRVEYDVARAQARFESVEALDVMLAKRLGDGT
jgi:diadenosine tetraphosphatase ApaH/serine/threonine PP2A family protein phosphatase